MNEFYIREQIHHSWVTLFACGSRVGCCVFVVQWLNDLPTFWPYSKIMLLSSSLWLVLILTFYKRCYLYFRFIPDNQPFYRNLLITVRLRSPSSRWASTQINFDWLYNILLTNILVCCMLVIFCLLQLLCMEESRQIHSLQLINIYPSANSVTAKQQSSIYFCRVFHTLFTLCSLH